MNRMNSGHLENRFFIHTLSFALIFLFFVVLPASAFQFSPLEQEFGATGPDSQKTYTIVNDSDDYIAVALSAAVRDQDEEGNEVNRPAPGYFTIVPQQVLVPPRSTQPVRIQYRGPRTATAEMAFRIIAEQRPYNQGRAAQGQGMFTFQFTYNAAAYVLPTQKVVRVQAVSAVPTVMEDGARALAITLQNSGNVHQLLDEARMSLQDDKGRSIILADAALARINGMNLLARKTVTVSIPWPEDTPQDISSLTVTSFTYTKR